MTGELQQEQKRREVLDRLYPWYKEEVFRRRERMIWLTAFGGATLVVVLLFVPVVPAARSPLLKAMACVGVVLFNGTMAALILQQAERHRLAKQALIRIEQAIGLYEEGRYLTGTALYPESWQHAWLGDRSVLLYQAILVLLTALVIASVLVQ